VDRFKKKYNLFSDALNVVLIDFYHLRTKQELEILNEDYTLFIQSAKIAQDHIVNSLPELTTAAESSLKRLKPTAWDVKHAKIEIKLEPLPVKEKPLDKVEICVQPSTSKSSNTLPPQ
jgi:hypothetical protein